MAKIFGSFKSGVRAAFDPLGRALIRARRHPGRGHDRSAPSAWSPASVVFAARGHLVIAAIVIITLCCAARRARRRDGPGPRPRPPGSAPCSTRPWTGSPTGPSSARWPGGSPTTGQHVLAAVGAGLPGRRPGRLVREGPGRGARLHLQRRHRRAHGAADPGRHRRPARPASGCAGAWPPCCGCWPCSTVITIVQRLVHVRRQRAGGRRRARRAGAGCDGVDRRTGAVELGYAAGWRLVRALPRVGRPGPLFRAGADRAARKRGPGAQRLARNLRRVVGPDVQPRPSSTVLVRDGLRSYARYWLEAFRLPALHPAAGPATTSACEQRPPARRGGRRPAPAA